MTKRTLAIGLAVVALLAGGGFSGALLYASRQGERQAELVLAQLPPGATATHGAISYTPLANRLTIEDLTLDLRLPVVSEVHVARVTVDGLNRGLWALVLGRSPDGVAARSVVLEQIAYDMEGGLHQSIERASLIWPRLDPVGGASPQTLAEWLAALSLTSAEATNLHIVSTDRASGVTFDMTTATRRLSTVTHGHLAGLADEKIVADLGLSPTENAHFEIAEATSDDVDLLGYEKILNPANYGESGGSWERDPAFYTLAGSLALSGLAVSVTSPPAEVTVSLERLSMGQCKMRQPPFPLGAATGLPPDAGAMADLLQSFSVGAVEIKQLAVTPKSGLIPGSFALGNFALRMGDGRIDHFELGDLAIKSPGMTLALGALQLDGLAVRLPAGFRFDPLAWAANPLALPRAFVERFRLADVLLQIAGVGEHSLKDLTATMAGTLDGPTGATLDMTQLAVDFGALNAFPPLDKLGYGKVNFGAHGEAIYDTAAKTVAVKSRFGAPEMGELTLAYRLGSYPDDWTSDSAEALEKVVMAVAVERAELRYDDASLVDHLFQLWAASAGETAAAARQQALDRLDELKATYRDAPRAREALEAATAFLRAPKSIRAVAEPPSPVTIGELYRLNEPDPDDVMELLGLKVDRP